MYQYQEPTPFRFVRARQLLKIEVRDHVIVGREKPSYLSST
jgi:DNA repair protein RadC